MDTNNNSERNYENNDNYVDNQDINNNQNEYIDNQNITDNDTVYDNNYSENQDINAEEISPDTIINDEYTDNQEYNDDIYDYYTDQSNLNKSINNPTNIVNNYNQTDDIYVDDNESVSSFEEQVNNSEDISFDTQEKSEPNDNEYVEDTNYTDMYNNQDYNQTYNDQQYYDNSYDQGYTDNQNYDQSYQNYDQNYNQGYDNYNQQYDQNYNDYNQDYNTQYDNYDQSYNQDYTQDYGQGFNNGYTGNTFITNNYNTEPVTPTNNDNDDEEDTKNPKPKYGVFNSKKAKRGAKAYNFGLIFIYLIIFSVIGYIGYNLWLSNDNFYFSKNKFTILSGSTFKEDILIKNKIQSMDDYTWSSENTNVATVDENGVITARNEGSTNIIATSKKSKKSNIVSVTVVNLDIKEFTLTPNNKVMFLGNTYEATPTINGQSSIIANYTWSSSNSEVASVDQNGNIKPIKKGQAIIYVSIPGTSYKAHMQVTVTQKKTQ